jgi:hypothetical protein
VAFSIHAVLGITMVSAIVPVAILISRNNIKRTRQQIIRDLEKVFDFTARGGEKLIPSFEFAAYKYRALPNRRDAGSDYSHRAYLVPVLIFMMMSFLGFLTASNIFFGDPHHWEKISFLLLGAADLTDPEVIAAYQQQSAAIISAAFLGGYVYSLQYFVRRISNFDLSPISFLRASAHIILACFTAVMLRHLYAAGFGTAEAPASGNLNWFLALAFVIGFFPTLGIQLLVERFPQLQLRHVHPAAFAACRSTWSTASPPS